VRQTPLQTIPGTLRDASSGCRSPSGLCRMLRAS